MNFITNYQEVFQTNSSINDINTRNKHLHRPNANLSCFQKRTFYAHIKILNSLPPSVTILKKDSPKFKAVLKKYLHTQSFYCGDDFFMCKDDSEYFCKLFVV